MADADNLNSTRTGRPAKTAAADPLAALAGKRRLAAFALAWERIWPTLVPPLAVVALFLTAAWLRLLAPLPDWARLAAVGLFALAFLGALVPLVRLRRADPGAALARLERDSGLAHQPLTALGDRQAAGEEDPFARALWQAHRRRLAATLSAVRVRAPSPRLDRRDPYALRFLVLILLVIGVVAGRGDYWRPLADAVRLPAAEGPQVRIDAWVTPPAYTGRAPVFLTNAAPVDPAAPAVEAARSAPVSVPQGSVVSLRVDGIEQPAARFVAEGAPGAADAGAPIAPTAQPAPATADAGVVRPTGFETKLDRSGSVILTGRDGELDRFAFAVVPDRPPAIALTEDPGATLRGAFRLAYEVVDDYRVAGAKAVFSDPKIALDPPVGTVSAAPRPLVGPPEMPLSLPRKTAPKKTAETFRDLSAHPWAGGTVTMRLEARDDAGNVGTSTPVAVVIPARPFRNPLARMLVEQRRILALDAGAASFVADTLDTVSTYTPEFVHDAGVQIGLRVLTERIAHARSDDDLTSALDLMWEMALAIDGGDASLAEQKLREARDRLRDALQNGASKEEIARLTDELRKAMQEYMQALQQQMQSNPSLSQQQPPQDQNARQVSPEDFQKMIDRIEELSKLGDREAAEQLLSQLDQMLENLQTAQPNQNGQQQNGQQSQGQQMMNELADMIRRQQELMNQTHKMTPDGRPEDGGDSSRRDMEEALKQLQQGQADLEKRLQQLMDQMQKNGMQPGDQLGQAQGSMKGAEGSLGQGDADQALGQQGRALDQLRQGAQQLGQQMGQDGQGQGQGRGRPGQTAEGEDPLGRPQRRDGPDYGDSVKVPGEIEVQRARRILEELRRRFSDQNRPALELDYLQRLLTPF